MFGFILFFFSSFPTQPVFIYLFLFDHLDRHEYIFPFILEAITVWYKPPPNDHLINEPIRKS
jgi:hypothetical protein